MTEAVEQDKNMYLSADAIPGLAEERQLVRDEAWSMVAFRENQLASGNYEAVPLEIDALSTAERVLEAPEDSDERKELLSGLKLDCLRLVAEWHRKLKPEYFPVSRHFFDAETGDFYSHGLSIRQMTENALRPIENDPEEVGRRVNERVENETPQIITKLGSFALGQVGIRTISECTNKAIEDFAHDQKHKLAHRGYGGYVPEIEKVMVRDMHLDPITGDRLEEQIGLPGIYINHYVIQKALGLRGVGVKELDKTELHGTQLIVEDDLIEFVELLDTVATEEWRVPIFMGEKVDESHPRNYSTIREEAAKRQEGLKDMAATVATFILDIAEDNFDRRKAPGHIEEFVKILLLEEAKQDYSLAEQMFNKETADGLKEVAHLESIGQHQAAFELLQNIKDRAPGGGYCSGGSCGLESVNIHSAEGKDLAKKLNAKAGDTVVKDKERACKCGQNTVVYAYNKHKVNKLCESCGAFESKSTK